MVYGDVSTEAEDTVAEDTVAEDTDSHDDDTADEDSLEEELAHIDYSDTEVEDTCDDEDLARELAISDEDCVFVDSRSHLNGYPSDEEIGGGFFVNVMDSDEEEDDDEEEEGEEAAREKVVKKEASVKFAEKREKKKVKMEEPVKEARREKRSTACPASVAKRRRRVAAAAAEAAEAAAADVAAAPEKVEARNVSKDKKETVEAKSTPEQKRPAQNRFARLTHGLRLEGNNSYSDNILKQRLRTSTRQSGKRAAGDGVPDEAMTKKLKLSGAAPVESGEKEAEAPAVNGAVSTTATTASTVADSVRTRQSRQSSSTVGAYCGSKNSGDYKEITRNKTCSKRHVGRPKKKRAVNCSRQRSLFPSARHMHGCDHGAPASRASPRAASRHKFSHSEKCSKRKASCSKAGRESGVRQQKFASLFKEEFYKLIYRCVFCSNDFATPVGFKVHLAKAHKEMQSLWTAPS